MSASEKSMEVTAPGPRVMIVDDDPDVRLLLQIMLGTDGLQVVGEAGDGAEALSIAWKNKPEVIILDQNMPGMKGEEAAPALRRILPGVRIVACSASFTEKPIWADDFVPKQDLAYLPHHIQSCLQVA